MVIYVDVDDTLVRSVGTVRIPVPAMVAHVRRLKREGATLYLWSAGGADYCRRTAEELDIADCFTAFLPKPSVMIDDQETRDWPFFASVHPAACVGKGLGDYGEMCSGVRTEIP